MKPLPCPFCGATPHKGLGKVQYCQLHGDPYQDYLIWCPKGHAKVVGTTDYFALTQWNTRAAPAPVHVTPKPKHGQEVQRYQFGPDGDEWVKADDYAALNEHSALVEMRLTGERDEANRVCEQWRQWSAGDQAQIAALRERVAEAERILRDAFLEHGEAGVCRPCKAEEDARKWLDEGAK